MTVFRPDGPVQRGWRPSLMWWLLLTIAVPFGLAVAALLLGFAYAVVMAVTTGRPIPNLTGGLEHILSPFAPYIAAGLGALITGYLARGRQIVLQEGGTGRPPFGRSSPPPTASTPAGSSDVPGGGLVNNEAIE